MKVKLLVSRAGIDFTQDAGDEIEVSDAEAARMIEAGQAEPIRIPVKPQTATPRKRAEKANK